MCDKGFIWNPNNCECECDKACNVGEYLDFENCKRRKKLADKLVDECSETVEEVKLAKITLAENCNNVNSVNPLYLMINEMIGRFEEKNENKYLILDDVDENKEVPKNYEEVWDRIKKTMEMINDGKKLNMGKIFKKLGLNIMMILH